MNIQLEPGAKPVRQKVRKLNPTLEKELNDTVEKYHRAGIIEECKDPSWVARPMMVAKRDGSKRMAIDYRNLNKATVKDDYPIPTEKTVSTCMIGAKYFSSLDMVSGYHQMQISEISRDYTAFACGTQHFRFKAMPFGLTNAPAVFVRFMDHVLGNLKYNSVIVYMDDIVIYTATWEEHLVVLRKVFQRFRLFNARLKAKKCSFLKDSIEFVGHVFSKNGIEPSPRLTEAITVYKRPTDVKELRAFLGLVSYYRKFIKGFER